MVMQLSLGTFDRHFGVLMQSSLDTFWILWIYWILLGYRTGSAVSDPRTFPEALSPRADCGWGQSLPPIVNSSLLKTHRRMYWQLLNGTSLNSALANSPFFFDA